MPVNLLNAQISLIRYLLGAPTCPMTNYMGGIEKTPNRAILKGRLFLGRSFCVHVLQSCMVTGGNIRERPLSRKGRRLFIPSTPVLGFPGPEKTQIFSFDKNYLSRPVMLRAPSEMKAGGPFYFSRSFSLVSLAAVARITRKASG